jgi:methylase of polypeptide subunit release factors
MAQLESASHEQLAALRRLFAAVRYTEQAICQRAGVESIYDFRSIREGRTEGRDTDDALDVMIRLFMDVEIVDRGIVEQHLGADGVHALEELGLLATYTVDPSRCHAEFLAYPTQNLWIVSDLNIDPTDPDGPGLAEDAVYPAISRNTRHFLFTLPNTPCDNFLELCAGTGIAALVAGKYARHTWATDITERATSFARINAALNEIDNCSAARGDLYEAVAGQTFDRIVAHPPYMPSLEQKYIFRDGGDDGEQITRRIIAGLGDYLRPGGRFYCTCMLTERANAPLEQRIRTMLGPQQEMFDLVLLTYWSFDPTDYYFKRALEGRADLEEVVQRHKIFRALEVEQLVYSSMIIERHATPRPAYTARRQVGRGLGTEEVEQLMAWHATSAGSDIRSLVLDAPLSAVPHTQMRVEQQFQNGRWVTQDCVLSTVTPFVVEAKCPPWMSTLIARCDGRLTTREHLNLLKISGAVPAQGKESEFAEMIRSLIDGGFLRMDQPAGRTPAGLDLA